MNSDKIIDINEWLKIIRERVESLSYGSVEITIHDSRIVELDTTKRVRLNQANPAIEQQKTKRFEAAVPRSKRLSDRHNSEVEKDQNR